MVVKIFKPVWVFRSFVIGSVKREFQSKYQSSLLGSVWTIINPLAMILVYTVIFSQVMRAKLPGSDSTLAYSIYLCSGLLTWGLFSEITSRAQNTFLDNANLLKKISFPRLCLPVVVVANASLNFTIVFSLFTMFLVLSGNFPGIVYLAIFPLLIILVGIAVGLGMILGVLNVFFRDVGQFFGIFLQFWFWLTPIVYTSSILSTEMKSIMNINPMTPLMRGFQTILVEAKWPEWSTFIYPSSLGILLCLTGIRLFRKRAGEMVDEL